MKACSFGDTPRTDTRAFFCIVWLRIKSKRKAESGVFIGMKNLNPYRMKKILLYLVLCLWTAPSAFAQKLLLAILHHDSNVTNYYGTHALQQAHEAAVDGDVINLTSGTFQAVDLTKAVTLLGAGMDVSSAEGEELTIITGNFNINVPDTLSHRLMIEGIYHDGIITVDGSLYDAIFLKSRFNRIENNDGMMLDCSFLHCKIGNLCLGTYDTIAGISSFFGCMRGEGSATLRNCIVVFEPLDYFLICGKVLTNCLITVKTTDPVYLASSSSACNCVSYGKATRMFKHISNNTNTFVEDVATLFKTFDGENFTDSETFELTEEAQKKYLGEDGTQVGMHGGRRPYDPILHTPRIISATLEPNQSPTEN